MLYQILAQVEQPSPDAGPFADVGSRILGVLAWAVPTISVGLLIVCGAWLAWAYTDPSQDESKPKKTLAWVVVGGIIASAAATIVNWTWAG